MPEFHQRISTELIRWFLLRPVITSPTIRLENSHPDQFAAPVKALAPARPTRRVWSFRLGAIALGLLPFLLLELALRWFGFGDPTARRDPLAGFSQRYPLFERVGDNYRTVRSRLPFFGDQEFAATKPTNTFRFFTFGGSTVYGHPYLNDTAFPAWLALEFAGRDATQKFEAINCGGVSYASYRLAPIVHEVLAYQPDLIILAMGHNEFLEDRSFQPLKSRSALRRWFEDQLFSLRMVTTAQHLLGRDQVQQDRALTPEVNPRLDDSATGYASYHRDESWRRSVVDQFAESFRGMIAECRAAKVPVLIVTLGSNLRDCPPFKSEHRPGLSPEAESKWQVLFDAAGRAEETNLTAALTLYGEAAAIDDAYALLAYRRARCFDALGQAASAREFFLRAKELDVCPLRMVEEVAERQRTIAAETQTPLVDARQLLAARCPDELPGDDIYIDHVHPKIGAHQRIARAVADRLTELKWVTGNAWPENARVAAYQQHLQALPAVYFANGRRRVEWLENWARRQMLFEETQPRDARGFLRQGLRELEFDREPAAWQSFHIALEQDIGLARSLAEHVRELRSEGRTEAADRFVRRLTEVAEELKARIGGANKPHSAVD